MRILLIFHLGYISLDSPATRQMLHSIRRTRYDRCSQQRVHVFVVSVAVVLLLLAGGSLASFISIRLSLAGTPQRPVIESTEISASSTPPGGPGLAAPTVTEEYLLHEHETPATALLARGANGYTWATSVAGLAYAPWDQLFYVAAPPSSVDVISPVNFSVLTVIPAGNGPFGVAVDPSRQEVLVTDSGSNNVTVINGTTERSVASISVGHSPEGIAYDAIDGTFFVANNGSNNLSVIRGSTDVVIAWLPVGSEPTGVAWDPGSDRIFVTERLLDSVRIINGSTQLLVGNVSVGSQPFGIGDDNATGDLYVANEGSSNVSVISARSAALVATVPIAGDAYQPDLQGVAYDSTHRMIWVTAGRTVVVIDPSVQGAVDEVSYDPAGVAFDPDNGAVCVTNSANVTFGCFTYGTPSLIHVVNITFNEAGLPTGTPWNVTLAGEGQVTQESAGASIRFGADCHWGSYNFSFYVAATGGYSASPALGYAAYRYCSDSSYDIVFGPNGSYLVTFVESGLPPYATWSVTLAGQTHSASASPIRFAEANGSYSFAVGVLSGYQANPASGTIVVTVAAAYESIVWSSTVHYQVALVETGLPTGTNWSVTLATATNYTTGSVIIFDCLNGSYSFSLGPVPGYWSSPSTGSVTVNGAPVTLEVTFRAGYAVTFGETGLPNGAGWSVNLSGVARSSNSPTIGFTEPNGTYGFLIRCANGYSANPSTGNVTVRGSDVTVNVTCVNATGLVLLIFESSGLPDGTNWSVALSATSAGLRFESASTLTRWSGGSSRVTFQVSPGSYSYSAGSPGYRTVESTVAVSGTGTQTVDVGFEPASQGTLGASPFQNVPGWAEYTGIAFVLVGAIGLGVTVYRYRSKETERGRAAVALVAELEWETDDRGHPVPRRFP